MVSIPSCAAQNTACKLKQQNSLNRINKYLTDKLIVGFYNDQTVSLTIFNLLKENSYSQLSVIRKSTRTA